MIKIFEKSYDGESLYDLQRDAGEAVSEEYNDKMQQLPVDQYGFTAGMFKVTIEWTL
jgi:hypothetical protein